MSAKSYGAIHRDDDPKQKRPHQQHVNNEIDRNEWIPLLDSNVGSNDNNNNNTNKSSDKGERDNTHDNDNIIEKQSLVSILYSYWSDLTFNWISPLLSLGNSQGRLDVNDLNSFPLPKDCETHEVHSTFDRFWKEELEKLNFGSKKNNLDFDSTHPSPSLLRALRRSFGSAFMTAGLHKLVHDSNLFVGPLILNRLIRFLRDPEAPYSHGLTLVAILSISQIIMSIALRHYFYKCYICGLQVRTAIVVAIYRKSMMLSGKERHVRGGPGEIANLVGIDAQRMQDLMTYLHAVWYSFFQIGMALYFLWGQVGKACLAGVTVILVLIPSTKFVSAYLAGIQKKLMKARDERVALNNEVLGSMKIIKMQAWEENFMDKLMNLRRQELKRLREYFFVSAVSVSLYNSTPLLVALATFAAYTLLGNVLDVAEALTALSLFEVLRFPLFMLPQIINRIVEAGISFERVREFLLCEEYQSVGTGHLQEDGQVWIKNGTFVYDSKKPAIQDTDAEVPRGNISKLIRQHKRLMREAQSSQRWDMMLLKAQLIDAEHKIRILQKEIRPELLCEHPSSIEESPSSLLSLRRVDMCCQPGDFVAIVGAVGSGKSTLINCLLGEGRPLTGTEVAYKGKLAVFLQQSFIMNDTLKNNILFGHVSSGLNGRHAEKEGIDEKRYELAIDICSLSHDLKLLLGGDQTEIGEKGITLSGGQRARVALARAVYHDADIYLLDDPLAAVDAHVAKDLFNNCIVDEILLGKSKVNTSHDGHGRRGRNATVVLVTNAIQYLSHPMVDRIICLNDGCVVEVGTYAELSSNPDSTFASFLAVISETSKMSLEQTTPPDVKDIIEFEDDLTRSANALDITEEPEVANVVEPLSKRASLANIHQPDSADENGKTGTLMTNEFKEREKGSVDLHVYLDWAKDAGGISVGVAILVLFIFVEACTVTSKWWLTHWSQGGGAHAFFFLGIYAVINAAAIVGSWVRLVIFNFSSVRASTAMFERLLHVIMDAPMSFFDTTPIGRIVNRFSKDMYTVDEQLVTSARSYIATMMTVLSTIAVVVYITPAFLLALAPIVIFYLHQQNFFAMSYRELKRLDSITRSPIYALLGETLDGVLTVRAFNAQDTLNSRMVRMLDVQQTAYFLTFSAQCWISVRRDHNNVIYILKSSYFMLSKPSFEQFLTHLIYRRLEFAGALIVMFACLVSVLEHGRQSGNASFAGLAGLSISFALSVTSSLNWTVRMASDVEANMVAVERIQQYLKISREAPRSTSADNLLPAEWPREGKIEFCDAKLRYRSGLPLVLKGLDIRIPAHSKVGVVGRTGAGKSTLMVALLRIVELDSGAIKIDGVDIQSVGLKKLRSQIAVIPQDPVLFSGTVRSNLDPFDEYNDERLFEVLSHVGLYHGREKPPLKHESGPTPSHESKPAGRTQTIKSLSAEISEGGTNYSVGQRQLLVIARAMLTGASIIIMDEATASVDAETDARIQRAFREEFKGVTCITVAHRLNTIMDSDLVFVMDDGRAAEFDTPSALLSRGGIFKGLVDAWEEEN